MKIMLCYYVMYEVLLLQIGAYDQQVWEKSLEQTDLNVRHLQIPAEKENICVFILCITTKSKITLAIHLGLGQQTKEDGSHQSRPHRCRLSKRWGSIKSSSPSVVKFVWSQIHLQHLHTHSYTPTNTFSASPVS